MTKATIAVVDDDPAYATTIKEFLEAQGHKVWRAADTAQFSIFIRDNTPDLVILDMQMPAGGGPGAVKVLKNKEETKNIPIIFISSMPVEQQKIWFKDVAPVRYLQKPPDLDMLMTHIKELLPKS